MRIGVALSHEYLSRSTRRYKRWDKLGPEDQAGTPSFLFAQKRIETAGTPLIPLAEK